MPHTSYMHCHAGHKDETSALPSLLTRLVEIKMAEVTLIDLIKLLSFFYDWPQL